MIVHCYSVLMYGQVNCYYSKHTLDDITNPRMIGTHIKNLIEDAMKDIVSIKRYIDDGIGIHTMTARQFDVWKLSISAKVLKFGNLKIKESDWSVPPVF